MYSLEIRAASAWAMGSLASPSLSTLIPLIPPFEGAIHIHQGSRSIATAWQRYSLYTSNLKKKLFFFLLQTTKICRNHIIILLAKRNHLWKKRGKVGSDAMMPLGFKLDIDCMICTHAFTCMIVLFWPINLLLLQIYLS